ncbi:MAG: hypothetical protein JNK58_00600 [Phycisphaerae bacterium]|nr:hypothetical protein [Phycisphaerae bacterium]
MKRATSLCRSGLSVALLAMAADTAAADSTATTMAVYAPDASLIPKYRLWNGTSWGSPASMPAVTGYPYWMVARNCPTRPETACVLLDHSLNLHFTVFNGSTWTTPGLLNAHIGGGMTQRSFDVAYEGAGDLLIAYFTKGIGVDEDADYTKKGWRYRTFRGTAVSSEQILMLPENKDSRWVRLHPEPASNRILLLASDTRFDLHAAVWTGSSFTGAQTIETNLAEKDMECWSGAYESQSRDAVIVYASGSSSTVRFRTVSGTTIGAEQSGPAMGSSRLRWVRTASQPGTDGIMLVTLNFSKELHSCYWNGSAWGSPALLASSLQYNDRANFDVAFQPDGAKCLAIYSANRLGNIMRRLWSAGSWSAAVSGSDGASPNAVFALFPTAGAQIFGMVSGTDDDLMSVVWNGSTLSTHVDLDGTIEGAQTAQPFMIVGAAESEGVEPDPPDSRRVVEWNEVDPR